VLLCIRDAQDKLILVSTAQVAFLFCIIYLLPTLLVA